jgi:hypothetical protein
MTTETKNVMASVISWIVVAAVLALGLWTGIIPALLDYIWHQTVLCYWWEFIKGFWEFYTTHR